MTQVVLTLNVYCVAAVVSKNPVDGVVGHVMGSCTLGIVTMIFSTLFTVVASPI